MFVFIAGNLMPLTEYVKRYNLRCYPNIACVLWHLQWKHYLIHRVSNSLSFACHVFLREFQKLSSSGLFYWQFGVLEFQVKDIWRGRNQVDWVKNSGCHCQKGTDACQDWKARLYSARNNSNKNVWKLSIITKTLSQ